MNQHLLNLTFILFLLSTGVIVGMLLSRPISSGRPIIVKANLSMTGWHCSKVNTQHEADKEDQCTQFTQGE